MGREWHRACPMNMRGRRRATGDCETAKDVVREDTIVPQITVVFTVLFPRHKALLSESCMSEPFVCSLGHRLGPLIGHVCPRVRHVRSAHPITQTSKSRKQCDPPPPAEEKAESCRAETYISHSVISLWLRMDHDVE